MVFRLLKILQHPPGGIVAELAVLVDEALLAEDAEDVVEAEDVDEEDDELKFGSITKINTISETSTTMLRVIMSQNKATAMLGFAPKSASGKRDPGVIEMTSLESRYSFIYPETFQLVWLLSIYPTIKYVTQSSLLY